MRALLVIALSATTASADVEGTLVELRRSLDGGKPDCATHLAALHSLGAPRTTTIVISRETRFLRRGPHSLFALRVACERIQYAHEVARIETVILKAVEFPWVWAGECLKRWPEALAAGVKPKEPIEARVRSRRGMVTVTGTLEGAYRKFCDNAYTPRRRNE